jgi:hypothetical protein
VSDTRKKDNLECNNRGDGGFIVGKAARGRDTRSGGTPQGFGSDEMSPLYENRCLTVGLV